MSKKPLIVFKYGGNAMTQEAIQKELLKKIVSVRKSGMDVIIVHGGGPYIQSTLNNAGIESVFIDGQRKTTKEAMPYVEMALKGRVNGQLVRVLNSLGAKAVGLSGKDGQTVIAKKRFHIVSENGRESKVDIGQVGNIEKVQTDLLELLLQNDYMPVITCLASDREGNDYNINGDIFAGQIAGALNAKELIVLTDIDGLLKDIEDPNSLISKLSIAEIDILKNQDVIKGGMIPKLEACKTALLQGASSVRILNGTKPEQLDRWLKGETVGTTIFRK